MKKLISRLLIAGAVMACQSMFAQPTPNDLYLGFQNQASGGTADYIINLGPASAITSGSSVVNLSAEFSAADFNSAQLTGNGDYSPVGGVIGGQNNLYSSTADIYLTQLRNPAVESPSVPGSSLRTEAGLFDDNNAFNALSQLDAPTNGPSYTGILDGSLTWQTYVDPPQGNASDVGCFYGQCGIDPDFPVPSGGILYEDLYETSSSYRAEPYTYLGYFMLDLSYSSPILEFFPSSANVSFAQPQITSTSQNPGTSTTTIVCSTVSGHYYTLEYATDVTSGDWTPVGQEVQASGSSTTFQDTNATDQQRFYQVIAHW